MMQTVRHILFIELLGGIGDLVIALPAIHALGRSHPDAHLTVLTFAPGGELLESDPLVHRVIYAPNGAARQTVDAVLAKGCFDLVVSDTNYDGIADAIHGYQCRSSHAPIVVTNLWRSPPTDERVSDRFLMILLNDQIIAPHTVTEQPQIHLTASERAIARRALGASYRPVVFLCLDAGMPIKRWSLDHFLVVGQVLQQQYGATVFVPVGDNPNQAEQLVHAIGGSAQIWKRGSLRMFAAALAAADLVVAADTGPAHIAAALNVPTITLFGPSWHERYGHPLPHINLQGAPACPERLIANFTEQHCWYSGHCPYGWDSCLDDISPYQVLQAASALLDKQGHTSVMPFSTLPCTCALYPTSSRSPYSWKAVRKLLVLRLDNIGDVIMTSPTLKALRDNLPSASITLMVSPAGALTEPLLPWVDRVLPWRVLWQDLGRLDFDPNREWELIETLKAERFDAAIILTSFSQSPHPAALICALAGIPLRLGESKEYDLGTLTHAVPPAADDIHQVERNLRLIESVGFQVRDRRLSLQVPLSAEQTLPQLLQRAIQHPYIVLNPWTTCQSRNYDPQRFAIAARQLSERTGYTVVVTGVKNDRDHAHILLQTLGVCAIDLIGQTSLPELVALINHAALVLTNNTSTMHIADALGTPNVVMFAGTELECQWRPRHSPSRVLRRATVCSPCYAFTCPYDLECLDIAPNRVVEAGLALLQQSQQTEVSV